VAVLERLYALAPEFGVFGQKIAAPARDAQADAAIIAHPADLIPAQITKPSILLYLDTLVAI
jgi:hypothetical protein